MGEIGLKSVKLVQIGDIHYPQAVKINYVDNQDRGFPLKVVEMSSQKPLQEVARALQRIYQAEEIDGILFCGDLTSFGDIGEYEKCIDYISQSLGVSKAEWHCDKVHVVPGNHDVDYEKCDQSSNNLFEKFEPFEHAWENRGRLGILPAKSFRSTTVGNNSEKAKIYSINSCLGCGETLSHHKMVQKAIKDLKLKIKGAKKNKKRLSQVLVEELNTPAFLDTDISDICAQIRTQNTDMMTILVSHHNLLPQAVLRIAIYAEVINGGKLRNDLLSLGKPLIYCHGHIHDDPVEIISNPSDDQSKVICISAPEIVEGFNLLKIEFNDQGIPLGCILDEYRKHRGGSLIPRQRKKIRFFSSVNADEVCGTDTLDVINAFERTHVRFPKLLQTARDVLGVDIQNKTLANILIEAEWFGLIDIIDNTRRDDSKHWQVKRL